MVNPAIFQDVNFIYDVRMYAVIENARSRVSLTRLYRQRWDGPGRPCIRTPKVFFEKENSAVIYLLSIVARFEDICSCLLCLLALTSLSSSPSDPSSDVHFFFSSILPADSLSLAWTLPAPFAKGTTGAWSILLMAHTRVAVDLGLKNRVVYLHCRIKERRKRDTIR